MEGQLVRFTDSHGVTHNALVTRLWQHGDTPPAECMINVVYVESDESKEDQYGRQIARATSVGPRSKSTAPGYFWESTE